MVGLFALLFIIRVFAEIELIAGLAESAKRAKRKEAKGLGVFAEFIFHSLFS
jgi:hypothetical protein